MSVTKYPIGSATTGHLTRGVDVSAEQRINAIIGLVPKFVQNNFVYAMYQNRLVAALEVLGFLKTSQEACLWTLPLLHGMLGSRYVTQPTKFGGANDAVDGIIDGSQTYSDYSAQALQQFTRVANYMPRERIFEIAITSYEKNVYLAQAQNFRYWEQILNVKQEKLVDDISNIFWNSTAGRDPLNDTVAATLNIGGPMAVGSIPQLVNFPIFSAHTANDSGGETQSYDISSSTGRHYWRKPGHTAVADYKTVLKQTVGNIKRAFASNPTSEEFAWWNPPHTTYTTTPVVDEPRMTNNAYVGNLNDETSILDPSNMMALMHNIEAGCNSSVKAIFMPVHLLSALSDYAFLSSRVLDKLTDGTDLSYTASVFNGAVIQADAKAPSWNTTVGGQTTTVGNVYMLCDGCIDFCWDRRFMQMEEAPASPTLAKLWRGYFYVQTILKDPNKMGAMFNMRRG